MNHRQLTSFGKRHIPNFIGVFPLNRLPKALPNKGSFIVNTHSVSLPGEHWIAVWIGEGVIRVFDPLGYFYPHSLVKYLSISRKSIHYNRIARQRPFTQTCGQHCLAWLMGINRVGNFTA